MSLHDYTGLTPEQIEQREAYLARHGLLPRPPEQGTEPSGGTASHHKSPISMDPEAQSEGAVDDTNGRADRPGRDPATGRFAPGWTGRPKGALNKSTLFARALLEEESEQLVRQLIERALTGDTMALRVATTRLLPARRDLAIEVDMPPLVTAHDAVQAGARVMELVTSGTITPSEGIKLAQLIETQRRTIETADIEARIERLEAMVETDDAGNGGTARPMR